MFSSKDSPLLPVFNFQFIHRLLICTDLFTIFDPFLAATTKPQLWPKDEDNVHLQRTLDVASSEMEYEVLST